MIIYKDTVENFNRDVFNGLIANKLENLFLMLNIGHESQGEYRSWNNSLEVVSSVLKYSEVDSKIKVAVEYQIPLTSKRVDFLISGVDKDNQDTVLAIELKQWDKVEMTNLENCVKTYVGGKNDVHPHPSQQILSYCQLISNLNETVQSERINLVPCAFLHNYPSSQKAVLEDKRYEYVVSRAPLFYKDGREQLGEFIKQHVLKPSDKDLFDVIEDGKLKPSKALQDAILDLLKGNDSFVMVDEQQVAYATITKLVKDNITKTVNTQSLLGAVPEPENPLSLFKQWQAFFRKDMLHRT